MNIFGHGAVERCGKVRFWLQTGHD